MAILHGAAGLFLVAFARASGVALQNVLADLGAEGFQRKLGEKVLDQGAERLPGAIHAILDKAGAKRPELRRLLRTLTPLDLAGIAWAGALAGASDDEITGAFGVPSEEVKEALGREWFIRLFEDPDGRRLAAMVEGAKTGANVPTEYLDALARLVAEVAGHDLGLPLGEPCVLDFVRGIVERLPACMAEMYLDLPRVAAKEGFVNTGRILDRLSGGPEQRRAAEGLERWANRLVGERTRDVFGRRETFDDLPPLRLGEIYVEPSAVASRPATPKGDSEELAKGPVKEVVRAALCGDDMRLVVLQAPFGYGKSLTCRSLAADFAEQWLDAPESAPFPLRLDCPDVLSGHVSSLETAVLRAIEKEAEVGARVAEWILENSRLLILLDSFDEVVLNETEARKWFHEMQGRVGARVRVLLASRPHAFQDKWLADKDVAIEIEPFDDERGARWMERVGRRVGPEGLGFDAVRGRLGELAGVPILLLMAAYGWKPDESVGTRAALYCSFIDKIAAGKWSDVQGVRHRPIEEGIEAAGGEEAFREALGLVAWESMLQARQRVEQEDGGTIARRRIEQVLVQRFPDIGEAHVDQVTRSLCLTLFLRKDAGTGLVAFSHRSFREYLAAEHFVRSLGRHLAGTSVRPIALELSEALLGSEELRFAADLVREQPAARCEEILAFLDTCAADTREIVSAEDLEYEGERGTQLVRYASGKGRLDSLRYNANGVRYSVRHPSEGDWFAWGIYGCGTLDTKGRYVVSERWHWPYQWVLDHEQGRPLLLAAAAEFTLSDYQAFAESCPALVPPVVESVEEGLLLSLPDDWGPTWKAPPLDTIVSVAPKLQALRPRGAYVLAQHGACRFLPVPEGWLAEAMWTRMVVGLLMERLGPRQDTPVFAPALVRGLNLDGALSFVEAADALREALPGPFVDWRNTR